MRKNGQQEVGFKHGQSKIRLQNRAENKIAAPRARAGRFQSCLKPFFDCFRFCVLFGFGFVFFVLLHLAGCTDCDVRACLNTLLFLARVQVGLWGPVWSLDAQTRTGLGGVLGALIPRMCLCR
jgi:hypothetical protein